MLDPTELTSLMTDPSFRQLQGQIQAPSNGTTESDIKHILVADDNHANQLIAKTILERDGYKVTIAPNGEDALMAVKAQASNNQGFDIILMDILMPAMDGIKALHSIKALAPQIKTPPIFAFTAFCNPADQHRYRMVGFDAILTKPLKHGDVEKALKYAAFGLGKPHMRQTKNKHFDFSGVDMLDIIIIDQLRRAADNTRLKDIQKAFWADISINSQIIKAALPEALNAMPCGLSVLRKSVHTVKGASASIGLLRAAHIARHLQNAPPSEIGPLLKALFESLIMSKARLSTALFQQASHRTATNQSYAAIRPSGANVRTG